MKVYLVAKNVCADGDGLNELIVAYTDRIVRAYRWSVDDSSSAGKTQTTPTLIAVDKWLLTGQVLTVTPTALWGYWRQWADERFGDPPPKVDPGAFGGQR